MHGLPYKHLLALREERRAFQEQQKKEADAQAKKLQSNSIRNSILGGMPGTTPLQEI